MLSYEVLGGVSKNNATVSTYVMRVYMDTCGYVYIYRCVRVSIYIYTRSCMYRTRSEQGVHAVVVQMHLCHVRPCRLAHKTILTPWALRLNTPRHGNRGMLAKTLLASRGFLCFLAFLLQKKPGDFFCFNAC